jgi:hypothetical protein
MPVWRGRAAACAVVIASLGLSVAATEADALSSAITYKTIFQDPGATPTQDISLEQHAISLIDATPPGAQITFAFRDFNRWPVANALIAAHERGVVIDGVIDGGERNQPPVQALLGVLGPSSFVICGTPTFEFNSCIANNLRGSASLQHNKFLTFSRLEDGREHVVLETSKNFLEPSQLYYYNDMVEIRGDVKLYDAYVEYLFEMKAQRRSDDRFVISWGDEGRNMTFTSPRRQTDPNTDDTIVDRMDEIDCSEGGSASGKGLIRVAQMAFRSERAVIMRELVALEHAGCDIEVVVSNADADIIAGLASAGIPVHPFLLRAIKDVRPEVIVHDKFWLVDAKSTLPGSRTKITYAGTSNWRGDEQKSDDLLLRIIDDGVYADYGAYWDLIESRAVSDPAWALTETVKPRSALDASPALETAGWNTSDVTIRVAGSDGHLRSGASGLKQLHVELSGAETGSCSLAQASRAYAVRECVISADGDTTIKYWSEDNANNNETPTYQSVHIDKTPPRVGCSATPNTLWPPNHKLVTVRPEVNVTDTTSGPAGFLLASVTSSEADSGTDSEDLPDDISGWSTGTADLSGQLRGERADGGSGRVYTLTYVGSDRAGNTATCVATVSVPKSQSE